MSGAEFPTPALAEWAALWRQTRTLTYDLLRSLPYPVMNFSPHADFGTLIRQIRHVADVQAAYLVAIQTGKMDLPAQPRHRTLEQSKERVEAYLRELDEQLLDLLRAVPETIQTRSIAWGANQLTLQQHLVGLIQHETLHHGMWAFYAKVADLPLPESWQQSWGLI